MVKILWIEEEAKTKLLHYKVPLVRAGYIVDIAESVTEAAKYLKTREYDLLIIDLLLPKGKDFEDLEGIEGVEMIKIAKDDYGIDANQIMVLTVINDENVHKTIRELGVQKIVVKRVMDIGSLKKHVDDVLEKSSQNQT